MSRQIAEGHVLLNGRLLKIYVNAEVGQLRRELLKVQEGIRNQRILHDDLFAIRHRTQRISRVRSALLILDTLCRR